MNPKPDAEGYIGLFEEESPEVSPAVNTAAPGNGDRMELGVEGRKILDTLIEVKPEEEWAEDTFGNAWNKIRSAFLKSKTAFDVKAYARTLSDAAWLDVVLKMAPRDVKVTGEVNIKHMLSELGPINKNQYRLSHNNAVEVEFSEVSS